MTGLWSAVVVFRGRGSSKTRLELDGRAALAEAFLLDTLAAVAAAERVGAMVLVTSDEGAAARARHENPGLVVVPDPGALNPAVTAGIEAALLLDPSAPVVALTGDLPALRSCDLDGVLAATGPLPAVVADRAGTGTTALLVGATGSVAPAFGPASLARHRAAGCRVLDVPVGSTLRLDVDTVEDLRDAEAAGVGARTALVMAAAA